MGTNGAPITPPTQDDEIAPLAPPTEDEEWPDERLTDSQRRFLKAFAVTRCITHACDATKTGRRTIYHWKRNNPAFGLALQECLEVVADEIEANLQQRALAGPADKSSARLGVFLLRAYRPRMFAPRGDGDDKPMPKVTVIISDGDSSPLPV